MEREPEANERAVADHLRTTRGRRAYEADVAERPLYHDGKSRRTWEQLSDVARWSWEKSPYPLPCAPENGGNN